MRFTPRSANHQKNGRLATNVRANINCILLTACRLARVEGRRQQQQLPGAEVKHVCLATHYLSQRNLAILMRDQADPDVGDRTSTGTARLFLAT